jgi:uncharacterized membrane protein
MAAFRCADRDLTEDPDVGTTHPPTRAPRTPRLLAAAVALVAASVLLGVMLLWPHHGNLPAFGRGSELVRASVTAQQAPDGYSQLLTMRVGADELTLEAALTPGSAYRVGDRVEIAYTAAGDPYVVGPDRRGPLAALAGLFVLAAVVVGRMRGLRAVAGLSVSTGVVLGFVVPALASGSPPFAVAAVGAGAVMLTTLYTTHGRGLVTAAAAVGTGLALALTMGLSQLFIDAAHLTGFSLDAAPALVGSGLSLGGVLLVGIVLASLGVLDDVTVTQAAVVVELHDTDPDLGAAELSARAMRVGRDHIGSVINTLALTYLGVSLPLLVVAGYGALLGPALLTSESVATEIVRTLVGSIGLIVAVPVTTALTAMVVVSQRRS